MLTVKVNYGIKLTQKYICLALRHTEWDESDNEKVPHTEQNKTDFREYGPTAFCVCDFLYVVFFLHAIHM